MLTLKLPPPSHPPPPAKIFETAKNEHMPLGMQIVHNLINIICIVTVIT